MDHSISAGAEIRVALMIGKVFRVLSTVNFHNHESLTAQEIGEVSADWLLPNEFEPVELSVAKTAPKHRLSSCGRKP